MNTQYEIVLAPKVLESINRGDPKKAIRLLSAGASSFKGDHNFHFDYGQALQASGAMGKALQNYRLAISAGVNNSQKFRALFKVALSMFMTGRREEGLSLLDKAFTEPDATQILLRDLEQDKAFASAVYSRMIAGYQRNEFSESYLLITTCAALHSEGRECAELVLRAAEHCDPHKLSEIGAVRRYFLSITRSSKKHFESSMDYLLEDISDPMRHYTLGQSFVIKEKYPEALECFKTAVELSPEDDRFLIAAGSAAYQAQNHEDAQEFFSRYLKIYPEDLSVEAALLFSKRFNAEWDVLAEDTVLERAVKQGVWVTPFSALAFQRDPIAFRKNIENFASENGLNSVAAQIQFPSRKVGAPIRIGFFGADYYSHATMILASDLLLRKPPEGFEVINFSYGMQKDAYTLKCMESSNEFIDCSELNDQEIVSLARSKALDVAIDLKGHTADNRLKIFSARVAPVQASFLGFPGTTGVSNIDYFIGDNITIPCGNDHEFSEKIIRLPTCYQPGSAKLKFSKESRSKIRNQLGISDGQLLYCNFNTSYKISPSDIRLWSEILKNVEGALFWYMPASDRAHKGIVSEFLKNGVDPQRILRAAKVPWETHLERLSAADCFLDTEVISAHTTARDAVLAGLPVICSFGESFCGRVSRSILSHFGLGFLLPKTRSDYVKFACDVEMLRRGRDLLVLNNELCENMSLQPFEKYQNSFFEAIRSLVCPG